MNKNKLFVGIFIGFIIMVNIIFFGILYVFYNGVATEETFLMCNKNNMKPPEWGKWKFNGCVITDHNLSFNGAKYCDTKYFKIVDGVFVDN